MWRWIFLIAAVAAQECNLPNDLIEEIRGYGNVVDEIINSVVDGKYSNVFFNNLANFTDTFGNRLTGSENLEAAINHTLDIMAGIGLETGSIPVPVPNWIRGNESAEIVSPTPRNKKLNILGLGLSLGTGPEGITGEILIVKDFDELEQRASEVPGKIVFFNAVYLSYGQTAQYRNKGPNEASKLGAVAALIRSITGFSISSPHTGQTIFENGTKPIPSATVSLEDSNRISRLISSGNKVIINLKMEARFGEEKLSRNAYGDIIGAGKPEEYVSVSGHIDSWDVGQGAMDDAGGAFLAWHSLWLIKILSLPTPKRTMRAILWTGEEVGVLGAEAYMKQRLEELKNWTAALESDVGLFQPLGIKFSGNEDAICIMREIMALYKDLNTTEVLPVEAAGSDINTFQSLGIPMAEPYMVPNNYFWFHHSDGDTMDVLASEDLDRNLAISAGVSYILADLSIRLPRGNQTAKDLLS